MKLYLTRAFLCISFALLSSNVFPQEGSISADKVLLKVSDKLSGLKTLNYTIQRELNYESSGYLNKSQVDIFLDFDSPDHIIKTKFQMEDPNFRFIFNGVQYFVLNKKDSTIAVNNKPKYEDFDSIPGFYYSPVTLRNSLPRVIADRSVSKKITEKTITGKDVYIVEFVLDSKILSLNGEYFPITLTRNFNYRLTIDKATYLPLEVFRGNSVNSDFVQINFQYKSNELPVPAETSWFYSTYSKDYSPAKPRENKLIKEGQEAPEWKLNSLKDDAAVSMDQFKNKVVMIEFWISFCGYCIAAVPKLNVFEDKYKDKEFKLVAINAIDSKDIIQKFEKKFQPKYEILYGGEEIAKTYGIDGFPMIVILSKDGRVIYSGDFDPMKMERLEKLIDANL